MITSPCRSDSVFVVGVEVASLRQWFKDVPLMQQGQFLFKGEDSVLFSIFSNN